MIRIILHFLCAFSIFMMSCVSVEYTKTGKEYDPLPAGEDVKLLLASLPENKYEDVGTVRVKGGSEEKQIERAKEAARQKGGNGIMQAEKGDDTAEKESSFFSFLSSEVREFQIVRIDDRPSPESNQDVSDDGDDKKNIPTDYSSLEKASYKQLINDYASLKDQLFKSTLYPKKILKIPASFKKYSIKGDKLILLSTEDGKKKLYLITEGNNKHLKSLIKDKKKLSFVYYPVAVYKKKNEKYPVLMFVDEIKE